MVCNNNKRQELLNIAKRMAAEGLVVKSWGNVSAKTKDNEVLITPSAVDYKIMTAADLMLINMQGEVLSGSKKPSSEAPLHLAVYNCRKDVKAIVHTHSIYATSLAVARKPLPPIVEDLIQVVGGEVKVAPYAHPGSIDLAENCANYLDKQNAVLLANHGLVGVASSLENAFDVCLIVEKAAQIYLLSQLAGKPFVLDDANVTYLYQQFKKYKG